jgi:hypothetical protein
VKTETCENFNRCLDCTRGLCRCCDGLGTVAHGQAECPECHGLGSDREYCAMCAGKWKALADLEATRSKLAASERQVLRQAETIEVLSLRMRAALAHLNYLVGPESATGVRLPELDWAGIVKRLDFRVEADEKGRLG